MFGEVSHESDVIFWMWNLSHSPLLLFETQQDKATIFRGFEAGQAGNGKVLADDLLVKYAGALHLRSV